MSIPNHDQRDDDARDFGGDVPEDTHDPINEHAWTLQNQQFTPTTMKPEKYVPLYDVKK